MTHTARLQEMAKSYRVDAKVLSSFELQQKGDATNAQFNADACEHGARCIEIVQRLAAVEGHQVDTLVQLILDARALVNGVDR